MPEGPSLVLLREEAERFAGSTVVEVSGNSRQDIQRIRSEVLRSVRSWGKHLLLEFDGFTVRVHFLLFGSHRIDVPKEKGNPRLSLHFEDGGALHFYACSVRFLDGPPEAHYDWRRDVMSDSWDPALARRTLRGCPDTLVADALLDQDVFAGVGNIIKNEVLHRIRVHPATRVGDLPPRKLGELVKQAREYSFDFYTWKKQFVLRQHWQVHAKTHCPRDGTPLGYAKALGKAKRRAFWCDTCQRRYGADA